MRSLREFVADMLASVLRRLDERYGDAFDVAFPGDEDAQ